MDAPTVRELLDSEVVITALEDAWIDSRADHPEFRREQGGWIFVNLTSGELFAVRAHSEFQSELELFEAPSVAGSMVVATYHTHPNPSSAGWYPGPSNHDARSAWILGVPCIIRADDGIYTTGPTARRGGLTGSSGYPLAYESE